MTEEVKQEVDMDAAFDVAAQETGMADKQTDATTVETLSPVETISPEVKTEGSPELESKPDEGFLDGRYKTREMFESSHKELRSRADKLDEQNRKLNETIESLTTSSDEFMNALAADDASPRIKVAYAKMRADRMGIPLGGFSADSQLAMIPAMQKMVDRLEVLEANNAVIAAKDIQAEHDAEIKSAFPHVDKVKSELAPVQSRLLADNDSDKALLGAHEIGVKAGFDAGYQRAREEIATAKGTSPESGDPRIDSQTKPVLTQEQQDAAVLDDIFERGSKKGETFSM